MYENQCYNEKKNPKDVFLWAGLLKWLKTQPRWLIIKDWHADQISTCKAAGGWPLTPTVMWWPITSHLFHVTSGLVFLICAWSQGALCGVVEKVFNCHDFFHTWRFLLSCWFDVFRAIVFYMTVAGQASECIMIYCSIYSFALGSSLGLT